ncbi:Uncharacterized protein Rs2_11957 [Raphanus sativus]|nr:Uncharacterized protein Rs2_11957 [Raphanus sativus]
MERFFSPVDSVCFLTLYSKIFAKGVLANQGAIPSLEMAANVLQGGLPLQGSTPDPPLFAVAEMIVHRKVSDEYETEEQFEKALLDKLTDYPIAIGVPSYPSLFQPPEQTTGFHSPTLEEINSVWPTNHLMFCTGRGTKGGLPYVQLQDSVLQFRQGGFIHMPLGKCAITHFVDLLGVHRC